MLIFETWAISQSLTTAFKGSTRLAKEFLKADSVERLLMVLWADFGTETELGRDSFYSWREDQALRPALDEVLEGRRGPQPSEIEELASLIEPRLIRTEDPASRTEIAARMAQAAVGAVPMVVSGGGEDTRLLVNRMKSSDDRSELRHREVMDAIRGFRDNEGSGEGLVEALLVGPMELIGAFDDAKEAEHLAESGEPEAAAERLLAIADRMADRDISIAAESLRERAADLLVDAGRKAEAVKLLLDLAEPQIARGARWAVNSIARKLAELTDAEDSWIAPALVTRVAWPEEGAHAVRRLEAAALQSTERADHRRWLAALIDVLMVNGRHEDVISWSEQLMAAPMESEERLLMELDRLEAIEALGDVKAADDGWLAVLRWTDQHGTAFDRGLAYQRRATVLTYREDLPQAQDAYRRAMAAWAKVPGYGEQVADAFLSMQHGYLISAQPVPDPELRPLATGLRTGPQTPAGLAEDFASRAMSARLRASLPDASLNYWLAYATNRRVGSLTGRIQCMTLLGELFSHAGEPAVALACYLAVGDSKNAVKSARQLPVSELAGQLRLRASRWERATVLQLVGEFGRMLPAGWIEANAKQILEEACGEPDGWLAPQPVVSARLALAQIALGVPEELRERVFEQLRAQLPVSQTGDVIKATTVALALATNIGHIDASELLVEIYLDEPHGFGIGSEWVAERAMKNDQIFSRLREVAVAGEGLGALEALVLTDRARALADIADACTRQVERFTSLATYEKTTDGEQTTVSASLGIQFGVAGLLARFSADEARSRFVERMLQILTDDQEAEGTRTSAANALYTVAPALPDETADRARAVLEPIALGDYGHSIFDANRTHPLSRWNIRLHRPNQLRSAAIEATAQLVALHVAIGVGRLSTAIQAAFVSGIPTLLPAAMQALALVAEIPVPFVIPQGFYQEQPAVRKAALRLWMSREHRLPDEPDLEALRGDSDPAVRRLLLDFAEETEGGDALACWVAENDPDVYFRALARTRLEREKHEDTSKPGGGTRPNKPSSGSSAGI